MNFIDVRKIKVEDYRDIYLLNQELGYPYEIEKVKEKITHITIATKDMIFVAQYGNEVIGYIHGSPYETLYLDSLIDILGFVVKEKYRNMGIGKKLIENLEFWAKENGFSGIRLVSGIERIDAHRFYQRYGYIYRKDQKNFIKIFGL
jgi:GNAT superfamily N-acetyltransferase